MKKLKLILWLIFIGIIGLIVYQNQDYLLAKQSMLFNSYLSEPYQSPPMPNAVWFLSCLVIGFLISYFSNLVDRFKSSKIQKELTAKIDSQIDMISKLRSQLESQGMNSSAAPSETVENQSIPPDPQE
jgi:ABC-type transport system involved in multi-copper enzyme maturation permease subunit